MTSIFSLLIVLLNTVSGISLSTRAAAEDALRHRDEVAAQIVVDELQN